MFKLELPFWMQKGELKKLNDAAQSFWDRVEKWLQISLTRFDLMTCDLIFVDHIAWERKISRLDGEIESIYRKRVNYAFINAQDAGMTRGMYNIFERLGIAIFDIKERQPNKDWDIVTIEMSDDILSNHKTLVNLLIQTYGATCRRYEYSVTSTLIQHVGIGDMSWSHQTNVGGFYPSLTITSTEVSAHINTDVQFTCSAEHVDNMDVEWVMRTDENHNIVMGYGTDIIFNNPMATYSTIICTARNQTGTATASQPFLFFNNNLRYVITPSSWRDKINNTNYSHLGFSAVQQKGQLTPLVINHQLVSSDNIITALKVSNYHNGAWKYRVMISISNFYPINTSIRPILNINGYSLKLSYMEMSNNTWNFYQTDGQLASAGVDSICYEVFKIFYSELPTTITLDLEI